MAPSIRSQAAARAALVITSGEGGFGPVRQNDLAFANDTLVRLANVLDAVGRVARIDVRSGHQAPDFILSGGRRPHDSSSEIDGLSDCEFVRHAMSLSCWSVGSKLRREKISAIETTVLDAILYVQMTHNIYAQYQRITTDILM
jgi:hypothetical protein